MFTTTNGNQIALDLNHLTHSSPKVLYTTKDDTAAIEINATSANSTNEKKRDLIKKLALMQWQIYTINIYDYNFNNIQEAIVKFHLTQNLIGYINKHHEVCYLFSNDMQYSNNRSRIFSVNGKIKLDANGKLHCKIYPSNAIKYTIKTSSLTDFTPPDVEYNILKTTPLVVAMPFIIQPNTLQNTIMNKVIIQHYIPGDSLDKLLKDKSKFNALTNIQLLDLAIAVIQAVNKSLVNGIIHRDIKPDNIVVYLDPKTNQWTVTLIDYEFARFASTPDNKDPGTLNYASPEILAKTAANEKSDDYSTGLVIKNILSIPDFAAYLIYDFRNDIANRIQNLVAPANIDAINLILNQFKIYFPLDLFDLSYDKLTQYLVAGQKDLAYKLIDRMIQRGVAHVRKTNYNPWENEPHQKAINKFSQHESDLILGSLRDILIVNPDERKNLNILLDTLTLIRSNLVIEALSVNDVEKNILATTHNTLYLNLNKFSTMTHSQLTTNQLFNLKLVIQQQFIHFIKFNTDPKYLIPILNINIISSLYNDGKILSCVDLQNQLLSIIKNYTRAHNEIKHLLATQNKNGALNRLDEDVIALFHYTSSIDNLYYVTQQMNKALIKYKNSTNFTTAIKHTMWNNDNTENDTNNSTTEVTRSVCRKLF